MGVTSVSRGKVCTVSVSEETADPISGHRVEWMPVPRKLSALNLYFHYRASLQNVTSGISLHICMPHKYV